MTVKDTGKAVVLTQANSGVVLRLRLDFSVGQYRSKGI